MKIYEIQTSIATLPDGQTRLKGETVTEDELGEYKTRYIQKNVVAPTDKGKTETVELPPDIVRRSDAVNRVDSAETQKAKTPSPLESMSVLDLRKRATELGIKPIPGSKADLVKAIEAKQVEAAPTRRPDSWAKSVGGTSEDHKAADKAQNAAQDSQTAGTGGSVQPRTVVPPMPEQTQRDAQSR